MEPKTLVCSIEILFKPTLTKESLVRCLVRLCFIVVAVNFSHSLGWTLLHVIPARKELKGGQCLEASVLSEVRKCAVNAIGPFAQSNLILAHLQHCNFNIVYIYLVAQHFYRLKCFISCTSAGCAIACSLKHTFVQRTISLQGTLLEARICAEHPALVSR